MARSTSTESAPVTSKAIREGFAAGMNQEVVLERSVGSVVDEVDGGIDLAETDAAEAGDAGAPLRGVTAHEVARASRQEVEAAPGRRTVRADELGPEHTGGAVRRHR